MLLPGTRVVTTGNITLHGRVEVAHPIITIVNLNGLGRRAWPTRQLQAAGRLSERTR
jgi:hypothetical protein